MQTFSTPPIADGSSADGVQLTLHEVVVPGAAKSFRKARWDEFVVTVQNHGAAPVTIRAIELESANLPTGVHARRRYLLERATNENVRISKADGAQAATDLGDEREVECDPDDIGYRTKQATIITVGIMLAIASLGHVPILAPFDCEYEYQLGRHGFDMPMPLPAAAGVTKTLYFPLTPAPTALRVRYEAGGSEHDFRVRLEGLAQLHLLPQSQP
jgi:hypothetical protein